MRKKKKQAQMTDDEYADDEYAKDAKLIMMLKMLADKLNQPPQSEPKEFAPGAIMDWHTFFKWFMDHPTKKEMQEALEKCARACAMTLGWPFSKAEAALREAFAYLTDWEVNDSGPSDLAYLYNWLDISHPQFYSPERMAKATEEERRSMDVFFSEDFIDPDGKYRHLTDKLPEILQALGIKKARPKKKRQQPQPIDMDKKIGEEKSPFETKKLDYKKSAFEAEWKEYFG